jgi:hypothetical protein
LLAREVQGSLANTDTHRPIDHPSLLGRGLPWGYIERKDLYHCQHGRHVKKTAEAVPEQDLERGVLWTLQITLQVVFNEGLSLCR